MSDWTVLPYPEQRNVRGAERPLECGCPWDGVTLAVLPDCTAETHRLEFDLTPLPGLSWMVDNPGAVWWDVRLRWRYRMLDALRGLRRRFLSG